MTRSRDIADQQKNLGGAVAPVVSGKNAIINGGFDIWQRGTSFTADAIYCADRWITAMQTGQMTISQISSNLPSTFTYGIKLQRNASSTSTSLLSIAQSLETINSIPLQGKTVTFSFWAKLGANFSDSNNQIFLRMYSGTGTNQGAGAYGAWTGYTEWQPVSTIVLTTTWTRYTAVGIVPSNATQIGVRLGYSPTGTAGADDSVSFTGLQLEIGSVATPFSRAGGTIGGELALCQRYYYRSTPGVAYGAYGVGAWNNSSTSVYAIVPVPITMRVKPTSIDYSSLRLQDPGIGPLGAISSLGFAAEASVNCFYLSIGTTLAASGKIYTLMNDNNAAGYLGFNAEL